MDSRPGDVFGRFDVGRFDSRCFDAQSRRERIEEIPQPQTPRADQIQTGKTRGLGSVCCCSKSTSLSFHRGGNERGGVAVLTPEVAGSGFHRKTPEIHLGGAVGALLWQQIGGLC